MGKLARYMDESPDGWFSYRRRVPTGLGEFFDQQHEIKHSHKTKIEVKALKLHALFQDNVLVNKYMWYRKDYLQLVKAGSRMLF